MRVPIGSVVLAAFLSLVAPIIGISPAWCQDFSITNPVEPPATGRRDLTRQLQAWWDAHSFYPQRASRNDEGGIVKVHLVIRSDGNIFAVDVVEGSGSGSLDAAAVAALRRGFVRPFPVGEPSADIDLVLHYVLARRHDRPATSVASVAAPRRPFTISNEPSRSPILETMLQRTCTGTVVTQGIRNHPAYGVRHWAQAIFFRKPDGTPWVSFYDAGFNTLSPVTEVGKLVQWTGREQRLGGGNFSYIQFSVWAEGDSALNGNIETVFFGPAKSSQPINRGGTVDLTCTAEVVPAPSWSSLQVTSGPPPPGDPP